MKRSAPLSLAMLLALFTVGMAQDSKFEPLIKEAIGHMNKMAEVLEGMKDVETAKKSEKDLNAAVEKMADVQKRMNALGKPSDEETKRIKEKFEEEMKQGQQRLQKAAVAAASKGPEVQEIIKKAMDKLRRRN